MRRKVLTACLVGTMLGILAAGALRAGEEASATLDVKLSVKGMTCAGCASQVRAALEKVPGVTKAEVDLKANEATVAYEKGKTTPEKLVEAIKKAGYQASVRKGSERSSTHS